MKRKQIIVVLAIFFLVLPVISFFTQEAIYEEEKIEIVKSSNAESEIWTSIWGQEWNDYGYSLWSDGNYLYALGSTEEYIAGRLDNNFVLIKWDVNGNIIWNHTWGKELSWERGCSLWSDGNYLYTLGSTEDSSNNIDFALVKWDMDGNVIWDRTWEKLGRDRPFYVYGQENYIYTLGYTNSELNTPYYLALVKWDMDGNVIWDRTWEGSDNNWGRSICGSGNYLYTLGGTSTPTNSNDFVLIKWDVNGNIIWSRTWGGLNGDAGYSLWSDGSYLYALGATESFSGDFALVKWDMDGNVIWESTWGGPSPDAGYSLWGDGSYLYALGETSSFGSGLYDFALVKWDMDGNVIWDRTWGGPSYDWGYSIWGDQSYLYLLGSTSTESFDLVLIKIDVNTPLLSNPEDIHYEQETTEHNITWTASDADPDSYTICKNNINIESDTWISSNPITINVDGLSPGTYNYTITAWDMSGNTALDTVIVQVTENIPDETSEETEETDSTETNETTESSDETEETTETENPDSSEEDNSGDESRLDLYWFFGGSLSIVVTSIMAAIIGAIVIVVIYRKKN